MLTSVAAIAPGRLAEATTACRALLICPNVAEGPRADAARLLQMLGGSAGRVSRS